MSYIIRMFILTNQPLNGCSKEVLDFIDEGCYGEDFTDFKMEIQQSEHASENNIVVSCQETSPITFRFLAAEKFQEKSSDLNTALNEPSRASRLKQKEKLIVKLANVIDGFDIEIPSDANEDSWEMLDATMAWIMKKYDGYLYCIDGFFDKDLQKIYKL